LVRFFDGKIIEGGFMALEIQSIKLLAVVEQEHIEFALKQKGYNLTLTARALGIAIPALANRIKKHGIIVPSKDQRLRRPQPYTPTRLGKKSRLYGFNIKQLFDQAP
jgi:hypothetical protein